MTSDAFNVDTGQVANWARLMANLSDDLRSALDVVNGVSLPEDAYGQVGRAHAQSLGQLGADGRSTLQAGVDALEWVSSTLTKNASSYEHQEQAQATAFGAVGEELP